MEGSRAVAVVPDDLESSGFESPLLINRLRAICVTLESGHARPPDEVISPPPSAPLPAIDAGFGQVWTLVDCCRLDDSLYLITRLDSSPLPSAAATRLTSRERRVAEQVALGEGLKSIAVTCSLSIQAVSTYLVRAKRKLHLTSRAELTRYLLADGGDAAGYGRPRPTVGTTGTGHGSCLWSDLRVGAEQQIDDRWFRFLRGRATQGRAPAAPLTQAELEVLVAIFRGLKNAEIARARRRSVRTVAAQVSSVLHKSGASSRGELIAALAATIASAAAMRAL